MPLEMILRENEAGRSHRIQEMRKSSQKCALAFLRYGILIGLIWLSVLMLITGEADWSIIIRMALMIVVICLPIYGLVLGESYFSGYREWRVHTDGIAIHASDRYPRHGFVRWRHIRRLEYTLVETPVSGVVIALIFAHPWKAGAPRVITVQESEDGLMEKFSGHPVTISRAPKASELRGYRRWIDLRSDFFR